MKTAVKILVLALVMALSFGVGQAQAVVIPADIVWIIDESGSMGDDHTNIKANVNTIAQKFIDAGIDPRFALVGFGRAGGSPAQRIHLITDLTDKTGLAAALTTLVLNGSIEESFAATRFALDNVTFRPGAVKNLIVVTDEDSDGAESGADAALTAANALWNGIVGSDIVGPAGSYQTLADNHGGKLFNIVSFRNDPQTFLDNFLDTKVQEIKRQAGQAIPEPASMMLLGSGLLGMVGLRKKKRG